MVVTGFDECEFENNGNKYTYKSYDEHFTMDNTHLFGLINYNCDNHTGASISTFECKPCGLFCNYNQSVGRCRHVMVPYILGGVVGLIVGVLIYISSKYAFNYIKVKLVLWWNFKMMERNDKKRVKMARNINETTGIATNISPE